MKEAMFQEPREQGKVRCFLCAHRCLIPEGKRGICAVRENVQGKLFSLVYDKIIARNADPVEKKPLFHFLPGSRSYSIAAPGCNFRCRHCQNADISQLLREGTTLYGSSISPSDLVQSALQNNCRSISYTYTEPTIYFELAYETALAARKAGIRNVFVTNGYITPEALTAIAPVLDAANIDLKSFSDEFYRSICGARLEPVLEAIRLYKNHGIWIEITTLVIPGKNDSEEELRRIAEFIASIDPGIPWHVSRFHPTYKLTDAPVTPVETLKQARSIGIEAGLGYVYLGNIPGEGEHTVCSRCGKVVLRRFGYSVEETDLPDGRCGSCNTPVPGVWK